MHIIQVVPSLPPHIDGIGDYAMQLARSLMADQQVNTSFIVCNAKWIGTMVEGFKARALDEQNVTSFVAEVDRLKGEVGAGQTAILLHFSPYGYQRKGYPAWLAESLEEVVRDHAVSVSTLFHELDVQSKRPWSSAFWVSPLQRRLIKRIACISRLTLTNTPSHKARLLDLGIQDTSLIANFSTIGEPRRTPCFAGRKKDLIIFGRADQRRWTYGLGGSALKRICHHLKIERIVDIGQPIPGDHVSAVDGCPIVRYGPLDPDKVSNLMKECIGIFLHYPIAFLPKSSVFAVASAHGAIPFVHGPNEASPGFGSLRPDEDYVPVTSSNPLPAADDLEEISTRVFARYQKRSSHVAAQQISRLLQTA